MTPLPPSRYRIEERGRRLVVIDQWAGNVEVTASMPARADVVAPGQSASVTPGSLSASAATQRLAASASSRSSAASATDAPRVAGQAGVGGAGGKQPYPIARTLLKLRVNSAGAAQLTTTRLYDMKAPRTVWLTAQQMQSLNGLMVFGLIVVAVVATISFVTTPLLLVVPGFFLFNAAKGIRSKLTEKIDKLDPR